MAEIIATVTPFRETKLRSAIFNTNPEHYLLRVLDKIGNAAERLEFVQSLMADELDRVEDALSSERLMFLTFAFGDVRSQEPSVLTTQIVEEFLYFRNLAIGKLNQSKRPLTWRTTIVAAVNCWGALPETATDESWQIILHLVHLSKTPAETKVVADAIRTCSKASHARIVDVLGRLLEPDIIGISPERADDVADVRRALETNDFHLTPSLVRYRAGRAAEGLAVMPDAFYEELLKQVEAGHQLGLAVREAKGNAESLADQMHLSRYHFITAKAERSHHGWSIIVDIKPFLATQSRDTAALEEWATQVAASISDDYGTKITYAGEKTLFFN